MTAKRTIVAAVIVAGIAVLATQTSVLASKTPAQAAIGKPAPDFALKDSFGKEHRLSEHKGQIVVLEWTNLQCPYVVNHHTKLKTTQQAYAKYAEKGVVWLAIDSTDHRKPDENRIWGAKNQIAYPILRDPTGEVGRAYGAKTTPHMFVINKDGTLVYAGAIDDRGSQNYVAAALDAILSGKPVAKTETKPYGCSVKYRKQVASAGGNGGNGGETKSGCCPVGKKVASGNGGNGGEAKDKSCPACTKGANGDGGDGCEGQVGQEERL